MGVSVAWVDGALEVTGEIDGATCEVLARAIVEHTAGGRIVIDMARCAFCDSSCLRCLITPTKAGTTVVVRRPSPAVRKVLAIIGLEHLLTIED